MIAAHGWTPGLVSRAMEGCRFADSPWHGARHWARVKAHGLDMARHYGVSPIVPSLFALFHDCRRRNENFDPDHGSRAADLVERLALEGELGMLGGREVGWLQAACTGHSDGLMDAPLVVRICWDADRLDLGRVGITPDPLRLCTDRARDPEVLGRAIAWSRGQAMVGVRRQGGQRPRRPGF